MVAVLALAQALQFTTQQAKTPALLDAATTLKASARPLTKVLLDAAEGASDEARAETMKTLRDMLCSPSAASRSTFVSGRAEALRVVAASRSAGVLACCVVNCSACPIAAQRSSARMVLGVLGRGADSAVLIVYLRVVLLPQALFLPRFDPCATSTAVPRLLGELLKLREQAARGTRRRKH